MWALTGPISSCGNSLLNAFKVSTGALSAAFVTPVRYRFFEDKQPYTRRWGYEDKLERRGLLPRVASGRKLPIPEYVPSNKWSERKALFGQNDYIDILGDDENITPIKFAYHIPSWLRGFHGNEYQMLLRKRAKYGAYFRAAAPRAHLILRKRLKFLYRKMNYNTKSFMDPRVLRR